MQNYAVYIILYAGQAKKAFNHAKTDKYNLS